MSTLTCTEVTTQCPVEATIYGYAPQLASNTTLLVIFALCFVLQLVLYLPRNNRAFTIVLSFGCLLESVGYGARLAMNSNPWSDAGFKIQLVFLILAPSFLAAGLYLTLKRLVQHFGRDNSRLPPGLYTWVFIGCDALSIVIQAIGGGIAASTTGDLLDTGNSLMIAGIAIQVATMFLCALLAVDFVFKTIKTCRLQRSNGGSHRRLPELHFTLYLVSVATAFTTVLVRCIYRLPEMAGGWGNPLMRKEEEFLVLDGGMIAIAAILMTIAHPSRQFPTLPPQQKSGECKNITGSSHEFVLMRS